MIDELDTALAAYLSDAVGPSVTIGFDQPSASWPCRDELAASAVLSCFLAGVEEDLAQRAADWSEERTLLGRVAARRAPTRHYRFRYVVSAWASSARDEHRLLGAVLDACLISDVLPVPSGTRLGECGADVVLHVALPTDEHEAAPYELWSSLGVALRASVTIVVDVGLRPPARTDIAPPAEQIELVARNVGSVVAALGADDPRSARTWTTFRIRETTGAS